MTAVAGDRRRNALRFGQWAEFACRARLRLTGWRVLARNFRAPVGEIDIIARRGGLVAFIEVKARAGAAGAPTSRQRARIARAAALFLARNPALADCAARFDVMRTQRWPHPRALWPERLGDAWRPDFD